MNTAKRVPICKPMRIRFQNARIVDARGERAGDVVTENGRISADTDASCDRTVALDGRLILMPAFVDTHCHLRDPGWPEKETMESGMRAALSGGYATLCQMANTRPACDTPGRVMKNLKKARALRLCRLIQAGAAGEELSDRTPSDYAALARVTPVLSNDGKTIEDAGFMTRLLMASRQYGFLISTHCQPERRIVSRDLALLAETGGRLHVGHISRAETAQMIRDAKAKGLPVTCEVMPHHVFGFDDPYRVNPPMRTADDVRALIRAIADGTVDCLATDHAPHTEQDKQAGAAGISNIEHAAAIFHTVFCDNGLSLPYMSRLMSETPSRLLGLGGGRIEPGMRADLTVFDPDAVWTIRRDEMISRSHNTPFEGRTVRGRVCMTMVEGEIRYDNGSFVS